MPGRITNRWGGLSDPQSPVALADSEGAIRTLAVSTAGVLSTVPPPGPPGLVTDDFTRADGVGLGVTPVGAAAWQYPSGMAANWSIVSNAAHASGGGNMAYVDTGLADGTLGMTKGGGNTALMWRTVADCSSGFLWISGSIWSLPGFGQLADLSGDPAPGATLTVILAGTLMTFKVNGTTTGTYTSSTNVGQTRHGLYCNGSTNTFDDFSFTP